jgi:hypothetical protein
MPACLPCTGNNFASLTGQRECETCPGNQVCISGTKRKCCILPIWLLIRVESQLCCWALMVVFRS